MKAFRRLKSLWQSDRGNVIAIGAATLPLLMGSAGLAIDSVQMAMWKRQLQRAADSAAIAGGHALAQGASTDSAVANDIDEHIDYDLDENETPMLTDDSPRITPGIFADGSFSTTGTCATSGATMCWDKAVEVSLAAERRLPFMSMFTRSATRLTARATAAVVPKGRFCLISLYNGNETGVRTGGNTGLSLGCGVTTNARGNGSSTPAFKNYGSSLVTADPVAAVGSIGGNADFAAGTTLLPYSSPVEDPFAEVPDPTLPDDCGETLTLAKDSTMTIDPSADEVTCYSNWNINGTLTLKPGTYYVNGGTLDIGGKIVGDDVTIILVGDGSDLTQSGGGILDIDAPEDGDYEGIALYRERDAAVKEIKLNGGADLLISGAIYMPSTDFTVNGNTEISSTCLQIVARKLHFSGGGDITNECAGQTIRSITYDVVRLVG